MQTSIEDSNCAKELEPHNLASKKATKSSCRQLRKQAKSLETRATQPSIEGNQELLSPTTQAMCLEKLTIHKRLPPMQANIEGR